MGGLEPEEAVRPVALSSLQELDTDRSDHEPIELTTELVQRAEVIVALKLGRHRSADGAEWAFMVGMMRFPPTRSRPCGGPEGRARRRRRERRRFRRLNRMICGCRGGSLLSGGSRRRRGTPRRWSGKPSGDLRAAAMHRGWCCLQ